MYSHCESGGWILGNAIDGTQAEYVRIPHAESSLYRVPAQADEEAVCATGERAIGMVRDLTAGHGVDTAIEAVGVPDSFLTCEGIVAAGGTIANVGVRGATVSTDSDSTLVQF